MSDKSIKIVIDSALKADGFRKAEQEATNLAQNVKRAGFKIAKIGGALALIPAAFKKGWDWGQWLSNKFIMPFLRSKKVIDDAVSSSKEFTDAISKASADSVAKIADEYKDISAAAKSAADERQREMRYMTEQIKLLHEQKDAQLELSKQRKLSTLAPDDEVGRAKIEQEFAAMSGVNSAVRDKEAAVIEIQSLQREAEESNAAAAQIEEIISKLEKKLLYARTRAATLSKLSAERNEKDNSWKRFFGISHTSEGDEVRNSQKEAAIAASTEAKKIEADIKAKRAEAEKLRASADDAMKRHAALWTKIETSELKLETEKLKNASAEAKIKTENVKKIKDIELRKAKDVAKAELEERRKALRLTHDERMKQLDTELFRVESLISAAKSKGYDNIMRTAGGGFWGNGTLDQSTETRYSHQRIVDAERAAKAEDDLRKKMARRGATLDNPTRLGRMSNLERAAFERMKLKAQEKEAAKIQKEKDKMQEKMAKDLDEINEKLKGVGL